MTRAATRFEKSDPRVKQLMRARYPYDEYQSADASRPDYLPTRRCRAIHDEMDAYERMLTSLPQATISLLYREQRSALSATEQNRIDDAWSRYCFEAADMQPDLNDWIPMELWTIEEAVALAVGLDPAYINPTKASARVAVSAAARKYIKLYDRAERALIAKSLSDPISPSAFCEWAQKQTGLVNNDFTASIPIDSASAAVLRDKVSTLETELSTAHKEAGSIKQRLRTLQKMLLAIATGRLSYEPGTSNGAAKTIETLCELAGTPVGQDTIKSHLDRAFKDLEAAKNEKSGS